MSQEITIRGPLSALVSVDRRGDANLLRITVEEGAHLTTLKLEGKLAGPWVDEMARVWNELTDRTPGRSTLVDLSGVTFIDAEGRDLLDRMFGQGAELRGTRLMTKYIIEEVVTGRNSSRRNGG